MPPMKVSEQVRNLIERSPLSRHRLCTLAKVNSANLTQFMAGRRGIAQETLDAVGAVLGFKVTMDVDKARKLAAAAPPPGRPPMERTRRRR